MSIPPARELGRRLMPLTQLIPDGETEIMFGDIRFRKTALFGNIYVHRIRPGTKPRLLFTHNDSISQRLPDGEGDHWVSKLLELADDID